MLYAHDQNGSRIEAAKGRHGICTLCKLPLVAKCGEIVADHWSHRAGDCDPWNEGETEWHLGWKLRAAPEWCEVTMPPHRADLRRPDGLVIELQRSSISTADIAAREAFYGNMWWLFHVERFGKTAGFLLTEGDGILLRWQPRDRPLHFVTKPVFCDLGGPIVEFMERLGPFGARGRLLSRSDFLTRVGLQPLTEAEGTNPSHHEVHWPLRPNDGARGIIPTTEEHIAFWLRSMSKRPEVSVRLHRLDGTLETAAPTPP